MITNPNGKGSGDNSYTVEGSIPSVVVLPSEAAQQLANYLRQNQYLYTEDAQAAIHVDELAYVIQEYWDSLV